MEGVGARLGRSSSRYGTTTVFNGPVRKWKKDWVPITPSSSSSSSSSSNHHNNNTHHHNHHLHSSSNGGGSVVNGGNSNTVSHLRLYKWTPLNNNNNNKVISNENNNNNNNNKISRSIRNYNGDVSGNDDDVAFQEPPRRKFKYIPIAVLEEPKREEEENSDDDEAKPVDSDDNTGEPASKSDGNDEKPDINDVPMEENQAVEENQTPPARQDLNELDLSLGLTSHDEDHDSDSKTDLEKDVQLERSSPGA